MFNFANRFSSAQPLPGNLAQLGAAVPGTSFIVERAPDKKVRARMSNLIPNAAVLGIRGLLDFLENTPSPAGVPWSAWLANEPEYQVLKAYFLTPDPATEAYKAISGGHRNTKGLTRKGQVAIREMMRLGMLIDIDHASEKAVNGSKGKPGILELAEKVEGGYPLMSGHNGFRALKWNSSENTRSDQQMSRLQKLGGMMGVGYGFEKDEGKDASFSAAIARSGGRFWTKSNVARNCGGSSRAFAQSFLYAIEKMEGGHVALGTDVNGMVPGPGPRFGPLRNLDGSRCGSQKNPVKYSGGLKISGLPAATNTPLRANKAGKRIFDINIDGVAHYGMLPDFFQDLANVGVHPEDMGVLFSSAEHLARSWDKALAVKPR